MITVALWIGLYQRVIDGFKDIWISGINHRRKTLMWHHPQWFTKNPRKIASFSQFYIVWNISVFTTKFNIEQLLEYHFQFNTLKYRPLFPMIFNCFIWRIQSIIFDATVWCVSYFHYICIYPYKILKTVF